MKYYYFKDKETGEEFVVGAEREQDALDTALEYFAVPHFIACVSEEWVDGCGFDVY